MIYRFICTWIIYWLTFFLQPITSSHGNIVNAWIIQLCFVVLVVILHYLALSTLYPTKKSNTNLHFDPLIANRIVFIGLILSLTGAIFLIYDKIHIQNIDYSEGLAQAREQWRKLGEERDGNSSSFFSALGYLLGSCYFLSLCLCFSTKLFISESTRFIAITTGFLLLFTNCLITGGRSGILLAILFTSYSYNTNHSRKKIFYSKKIKRTLKTSLVLFFYT